MAARQMRCIAFIGAELGPTHRLGQSLPQRILVRANHIFAIFTDVDIRRRDARKYGARAFANKPAMVVFGDQPFHDLKNAFI